ncbi:hypothetical protein GW17_00004249 [Ensete ventricosum]|nr:hypothetical protein GW17_00004249 [Ensete ventricosum]
MGSHPSMVSRKSVMVINKHYAILCKVEFRSVIRAPSQKLKILVIPNVLAHGKSYEHNFMKKHDGHTLYKSHPRGKHGGAK